MRWRQNTNKQTHDVEAIRWGEGEKLQWINPTMLKQFSEMKDENINNQTHEPKGEEKVENSNE